MSTKNQNKIKEILSHREESELGRVARVASFATGQMDLNTLIGKTARFIGDRTASVGVRTYEMGIGPAWRSREERGSYLYDANKLVGNSAKITRSQDYIGSYYGWNGPLSPEYDMQDPISIADTEAFVKQAINRRLSLMFRNGYEITGDSRNVDYINKRIATMSYVGDRTFRELLRSVLTCLSLQANCFLLKIRKDGASGVSKKESGKTPVSGYTIIPTHTIQPIMKNGVIDKWRRYYEGGKSYDDYSVDEIIHFYWDRKVGHIFGTPRTVAVRDDIFALRRLEENIELLFINYLFPLFHVKVGTEDNPATYYGDGSSELDMVKYQIENMPKEGVYVSDERTSVEVIGAKDQVLDFAFLVGHYKQRVFSGLGMSPLDMGAVDVGTRATSDNISQNLKDLVKADLEVFADQVKMFMFKEWFMEANYSVGVQTAVESTSLAFHEIDLDNKIKEENHVLNIYNSNLITFQEARERLKYKPQADDSQLHVTRDQLRLELAIIEAQTASQTHLAQVGAELTPPETTTTSKSATGASKTTKKVGHGRPRSMTAKKSNPVAKATKNLTAPANQHGVALGPTKAKSSHEFLEIIRDALVPVFMNYSDPELKASLSTSWQDASGFIINNAFNQFQEKHADSSGDNSYTKHLQEELPLLKELVGGVSDLDQLLILLEYGILKEEDNNEEHD